MSFSFVLLTKQFIQKSISDKKKNETAPNYYGTVVCIRRPCISLICSRNVSVMSWCCFTRDSPLKSRDSTMISYMAPHPPDTSWTSMLFAWGLEIFLICRRSSEMKLFTWGKRDLSVSINCFSVYLGVPSVPDQTRDKS